MCNFNEVSGKIMRMMQVSVGTRLVAILFTICACMLMLEVGLRLIGRSPTNMAEGIAEQSGDSFKLKRNITKKVKWPAFTYTIHTDEYGLRDKSTGTRDLSKKPFVVFLGGSDVFGNGVDYEDSFVGIFNEEASKKGLNVLNFAVGGHLFLDQESLLKEFIANTHKKPSSVLFTVNALHIPEFDQRSQNIIVRSGYIINRDRWQFTYLKLLAGNISASFCFFRDAIRGIQERYFRYELKVDSIEFLKIYSKKSSIRQPERIRKFREYLSSVEAYCKKNSIQINYIYIPLSDSFNLKDIVKRMGENPNDYDTDFYEELMRTHCRESGVRLISLQGDLNRCYEEGKELRFRLDPHYNKFANRIIGERLIRELLQDQPGSTN
jgi:hypothetical protein